MLPILEVQVALGKLGYYAGPVDGDYHSDAFRDDLCRFQRDFPACGKVDGWYGAKTDAVLAPIAKTLPTTLPPTAAACRRWRLTHYYVGNAAAHGRGTVPIWSSKPGQAPLAAVAAGAFVEAALNGSTVLPSGQVVTVSGWIDVAAAGTALFKPVIEIAKRRGWVPDRTGYAGIRLSNDRLKVTQVRTFDLQATSPAGWPIERGIACDPFRTVAADLGVLASHDPAFKGQGGVVPVGTKVFVLELVGLKLPDQSIHDGWVTVNDTGGAIVGAHFDLFTGAKLLAEKVRLPELVHVWFEGIEDRLPASYGVGI